jgi:hypothetical protein
MILVVGSVENERYLSTLAFMKSKLHIRLTTHLSLVVFMFAQHFYTIQNFPYKNALNNENVFDTINLTKASVQ